MNKYIYVFAHLNRLSWVLNEIRRMILHFAALKQLLFVFHSAVYFLPQILVHHFNSQPFHGSEEVKLVCLYLIILCLGLEAGQPWLL